MRRRRRPRVLMAAPGRQSPGGIERVTAMLERSPLGERFQIRAIDTHRVGTAAQKLRRAAAGLARGTWLLVRRWPDLVWLHVAADASFWRKGILVLMARALRTPAVLHVHGGTFTDWYDALGRPARAAAQAILRQSDLIITLSPIWQARLAQIVARPNVVIMNPVDMPAASPDTARIPGRVVCLGRVGDHKGSRALVRAIALLRDRGLAATLVLAGDGDHAPVAAEAERLGVSHLVELHQWLDRRAVADLLTSASVFALPSRSEGLPLAVLEAMAHGVPVVTTPVGGIPDVVADGETGLFVRPDDPEGLADALTALIAHPDRARAMGRAGRRRVEERCSLPIVADELGRAFSAVLTRRG